MVFQQLADLYQKIGANNRYGVEDWVDRLNLCTVILFALAALLVGVKQYVMNDISCYIPVGPSGEKFKEFVNDYCWVHGTIPMFADEDLPNGIVQWQEYDRLRRIRESDVLRLDYNEDFGLTTFSKHFRMQFISSQYLSSSHSYDKVVKSTILAIGAYYQWVPFLLGLQCILFYLPHIWWQSVCMHFSGGDLFALIKASADAAVYERDLRRNQIKRVVEFIEDGISKGLALTPETSGIWQPEKWFPYLYRKRAIRLHLSYMMHKVILILNAFVQLYVIQIFLGFHHDGTLSQNSLDLATKYEAPKKLPVERFWDFGFSMVRHLQNGEDWTATLMFPRVAFCYIHGIQAVGMKQSYTAQCALPINMLNEKIYIFFWFWIASLFIVTTFNLFLWMKRALWRKEWNEFIGRYLRIKQTKNYKHRLTRFTREHLGLDGIFIIRMLTMNAGELVTAEIVSTLYNSYKLRCKVSEMNETTSNSGDSSSSSRSRLDEKEKKNLVPSPNDLPPSYV